MCTAHRCPEADDLIRLSRVEHERWYPSQSEVIPRDGGALATVMALSDEEYHSIYKLSFTLDTDSQVLGAVQFYFRSSQTK